LKVTKRQKILLRDKKEIDGARGAYEFMEDVALATDLDKQ
jgi:hypothetical protein